ncbi:protein NRT1/ PTR FAMILY 4.5-like [Coffea eugenioides]|uniref:Protein NRT1/ PTR FAMILY 4.5 isoform X2 n=1 Tax=Coffea arabica TaxID=13443 RepID=A0A6P6TTP9_COFAR|nr:protein NRT1/ PTR FAMILY 4.5-like [Coffea arabica]XP_027182091.1 protein NRT1/ PTR FAMILY 4.5-like [Coffea eugenioides]
MDVENGESPISSYPLSKEKGGFKACMFVLVLTTLENIGFVANMSSLVLYFHLVMQFDLSTSANTLTIFLGSTFLLTILGGLISDTYLNRLYTCVLFSILEVLGLLLLYIQAKSHKLQPDPCGKSSCVKGSEAVMFYCTIFLLALGAGGVKGSVAALGADQFDQKDPKEAKALASFFNSYQFSITVGSIIGVTIVVWIAMNRGWHWGFLISLIATSIGVVILALGKPFYRIQAQGASPLVKISQVIVAAIRNRNVPLPQDANELYEIEDNDAISHTSQFRLLDKAASVRRGMDPVPWTVCTVTQVEEVKILIRMLPIIASTIIMNTCMAQMQTYSVLQGYIMNTHLGSFKIPSASIPVIPLIFMSILLPIYEFFFVPLARKITGHPTGITQLQRVGIGLVLSVISMSIAGVVEVKRRHKALEDPLHPISLFWLSFQYGVFGVADMFTVIGLIEFFYREAPKWMRSLSTSFALLSLSFGYFLSTAFVNLVNAVTKKVTPSKRGWLEAPDLNHNKLELFYWFLAILSLLNFFNYLFWASWYKYKTDANDEETQSKAVKGTSAVAAEN